MKKLILTVSFALTLLTYTVAQGEIFGELMKWHKITIDFEGPEVSETDEYNPFLNYRLNVTFTNPKTGKEYRVPGYFAADGDAANSSAKSGNVWRVHFSPDETGLWKYDVQFRKGRFVAVSDKLETGVSGEFMDSASGSFEVLPTDKNGRDFRARGRLNYIGGHYLRLAESGEYFLKNGVDAPENLLAYADFDGTFHDDGHKDNLVKTWEPHLSDWRKGDPIWQDGKGKGLIGAVNYLASEGLNAMSFLTLNILGDDQNVFPYIDYDTYDRMDVSKLAQWEVVFEHAQQNGIFLHFKTQEAENQGLLDNGGVGALRKLYYRELIARFSHHLALNWNLGEENGDWVKNHKTPPQFTMQRLSMAQYFYDHDPYHHHIVIHNGNPFYDLLGPDSKLTGPSIQTHRKNFSLVHGEVLKWRKLSEKAGKPWACAVDEPGDAQHALVPDADDPEHNDARKNALWGTYMAGGWGIEWYFGYKHDHSDLSCEDFRSRDLFWDQCNAALSILNDHDIPYWEMEPMDGLTSSGYCLADQGYIYMVYIPEEGTAELQLSGGTYSIEWFNPRTGAGPLKGSLSETTGCKTAAIGTPPGASGNDWIAVLRNIEEDKYIKTGIPIVLSAIRDFPVNQVEGFVPAYRDQENQARAVNASRFQGRTAAVRDTFSGNSGIYDIRLKTLTELDGESSYRLKVGDNYLCGFTNPAAANDYEDFYFQWKNVPVQKGELFQVEFSSSTNGKIPENNTTAYSRGRWTALELQPKMKGETNNFDDGGYKEEAGRIIIEPESGDIHGNWKVYTDNGEFDFLEGFSGEGCIRFTGNTEVSGAADSPIVYKIHIHEPGTYSLAVRALEAPLETGQGDKANDCYIRLEGQEGWEGKNVKHVLLGNSFEWSWNVHGEPDHHSFQYPEYQLKKGEYELVVSGRSKNFFIDRIELFNSENIDRGQIYQ